MSEEKHLVIGFTGTRNGMSEKQTERVREILSICREELRYLCVMHGDCVGADADFDALAKDVGIAWTWCNAFSKLFLHQ